MAGRGAGIALLVGGAAGDLARALEARGVRAETTGPFASRADADAAVAAAGRRGPLTLAVHVPDDLAGARPRALVTYDDEAWDRHCEAAVRSFLFCLQAAYAGLRDAGGRIVLVHRVPPPSSTAGQAARLAAAEAQQALAVSAAQRWRSTRVAVDVVAAVWAGSPQGSPEGSPKDSAGEGEGSPEAAAGIAAALAMLARAVDGSLGPAQIRIPWP